MNFDNRRYSRICNYMALLILSLAAAQAIYGHLTVEIVPFDDAFITYRYVNNLLSGYGLVYNRGYRVFGCSTPLYLLWLSAVKFIFASVSVPVLSVRLNLIFFLASACGVFAIVRRLSKSTPLASILTSLILVNKTLFDISVGGMESFMFAACVCWVVVLLLKGPRHLYAAAMLSGISCLIRVEGIFCIMITLLVCFTNRGHRERVNKKLLSILLFLPLLLWVIFAAVYYGSVIPLSIIAKSKPLYPLERGAALEKILHLIYSWFLFYFPYTSSSDFPRRLLLIKSAIFILVMIGASGFFICKPLRKKSGWIIPLFLVSIIGFYAVGNPLMFPWYYPVIYIFWFLVLFLGVVSCASLFKSKLNGRLIVYCFLVLAFLPPLQSGAFFIWEKHITEPDRRRIFQYIEAARYLDNHGASKAAAPEIGALGYYTNAYILDACGLVSPEALPFLPVPKDQRGSAGWGAISVEFVRETKPEFVVTMRVFAIKSLLISTWFSNAYSLVHEVPLPEELWKSKSILIFKARVS